LVVETFHQQLSPPDTFIIHFMLSILTMLN